MLKKLAYNNKNIRLFLLTSLLVIIGLLFYQKLFIFSIILVFSGILQYFTHTQNIKFNLGHVFFFGLITVKEIGLIYGIFLIVFAEFLPKALSGDMEVMSIIGVPLSIGLMVIFSLLKESNFTLIASLLVLINYGVIYFLSKFSGESLPEKIMEIIFPLFLNLVYIFSISGPILSIVGRVITV